MKNKIEIDGKIFKLQENGYYARNEYILLHRKIWEDSNGKIPKGFQIHHKDGDRTNNNLENLECISHSQHVKLHWKTNGEYLTEKVRENIKKAGEWRKTEEGRKYYSIHAKDVWKNSPKHFRKCSVCEKEYECYERNISKYCSRTCKHEKAKIAYREIRQCVICKNEFEAFKHNRTATCSKECRLNKFQLTRSLKYDMAHKQSNSTGT